MNYSCSPIFNPRINLILSISPYSLSGIRRTIMVKKSLSKKSPTLSHQPFYDPMSNAKVHRIYEATKLLRDFSLILLWFHDFVLPLHT